MREDGYRHLSEHAPNCNCPRCARECGEAWAPAHACLRLAPHKGDHKCCCGETISKKDLNAEAAERKRKK